MDTILTFNQPKLRFRYLQDGVKRLARINSNIENRLRKMSEKDRCAYPGSHVLFRTKRLPLCQSDLSAQESEYLFYAVDSFSAELFGMIYSSECMESIMQFLRLLHEECAYKIERLSTDLNNFHDQHIEYFQFSRICRKKGTRLEFTSQMDAHDRRVVHYVDELLVEKWINRYGFRDTDERRKELIRYINYFNWVQPHDIIGNRTPGELVYFYFFNEKY